MQGGYILDAGADPSVKNKAKRWWESHTPKDGYILNRLKTPFAFVDPDAYEMLKPSK